MSRVIISSLLSLFDLFEKNPGLMAIPSFAGMISIYNNYKIENKRGGCRCKQSRNIMTKYRPVFEHMLTTVSAEDVAKVKTLLNTQDFCYYTRDKNNNNKLIIKCL